jgi:hypothetical protein
MHNPDRQFSFELKIIAIVTVSVCPRLNLKLGDEDKRDVDRNFTGHMSHVEQREIS